jgi:uncharacterized membrane protein
MTYGVGIVVLAVIATCQLTAGSPLSQRVERAITLLFVGYGTVGTLSSLTFHIHAIVRRSHEVSGLELLTSSVALWVTNVLMFSLLYWQLDRGGPAVRSDDAGRRPDWLFPQEGAPPDQVPPGWRPSYIAYLYLAYSTATAFSTTDAMPMTARAQLLMMLESTISLMTIVVVASRAINILGS